MWFGEVGDTEGLVSDVRTMSKSQESLVQGRPIRGEERFTGHETVVTVTSKFSEEGPHYDMVVD